MTKLKYLEELRRCLAKLPASEIEDILADYQEHFDAGLRAGKSEEKIANGLGHPRVVAQSHLMTALIHEVSTTPSTLKRSSAVLRILALFLVLAPFNFLVVVGPLVASVALLLVGWLVPFAVAGAAIASVVMFLLAAPSVGGFLSAVTLTFLLVGVLGLTVMCGMLMWLATRAFALLIASYVRWNFNLMTARGA